MRPALLLVLPIALLPALAAAATGEQWERFRAEVEAACRAALDAAMATGAAELTGDFDPPAE